MANIPRRWKDSTNLEHPFECAQAARTAAALNRVCDTSSGTGDAREKHACMLTFYVASDGRSVGEFATWFLSTESPPHARRRHSCWSLPFRSARLGTARCRSSSVSLHGYSWYAHGEGAAAWRHGSTVHDVWSCGGKGKLRSAWKSKAQSWAREQFECAFIICDHVSRYMHVRRDAAQTRLQYVKAYPCNKRGKNNPVEMFLELKVCTEVQRNGRRLSNIFGKCQWIRKGGIETQLPFLKTRTRLCLVSICRSIGFKSQFRVCIGVE